MRRGVVITCAALLAGCYASHERGADAGVAADADLVVDPCGSVYVALERSGCRSFALPPTGTETCATPEGHSVHGPSFVFSVPAEIDVTVHIETDGEISHAFGSAVDACGGVCDTGYGSASSGVTDYVRTSHSMRYVVSDSSTGHPIDVRICTGEHSP